MAQDIFQMRMDQITERLPGIIAIHDDICVFGQTQEQHDKHHPAMTWKKKHQMMNP